LSTGFGGAWIESGTLTVAVTDARSADTVRAAGAQARLVSRSERQLDALKSTLDANSAAAGRVVPGWYDRRLHHPAQRHLPGIELPGQRLRLGAGRSR
jgi:hypothetical protein